MKLPRLERRLRVLLQWLLELCFTRDTVQRVTAENLRSRRFDALVDSARAAEAMHEARGS